ncbi:hypothetical protein AGLY_008636 [Aphis glycines]|uniref:Uncharacterized protein n=1 Tax=Aphis glycines TaxID=307491 RepID=A0A6G0TLU6_APHGL|nr:hypothetical protein AGLY_008636 [Aphis glycines]
MHNHSFNSIKNNNLIYDIWNLNEYKSRLYTFSTYNFSQSHSLITQYTISRALYDIRLRQTDKNVSCIQGRPMKNSINTERSYKSDFCMLKVSIKNSLMSKRKNMKGKVSLSFVLLTRDTRSGTANSANAGIPYTLAPHVVDIIAILLAIRFYFLITLCFIIYLFLLLLLLTHWVCCCFFIAIQ